MNILKLSTTLFGIFTATAVGTVDGLAQPKVPACIASFCVANRDVRPEAVIKALGATTRQETFRHFHYCYEFPEPSGTIVYGKFEFGNEVLSKVDWRLVSIDLSKERVCESAHKVPRARAIGTKEGIRIGSREADVRRTYGLPIDSSVPSEALSASFFGERKVAVDRQLLYDTGRPDDLLGARIFIRDGTVLLISVFNDE